MNSHSDASNAVSSADRSALDHFSLHPGVVQAVIEAVTPAVASAVVSQIHVSLQEPWFARIIEGCVAKYVCVTSSGSSGTSNNSLLSSCSGSDERQARVSAAAVHAGNVVDMDALCSWDVPCPVCGEKSFANEKVFYEHIVAIGKNRFKALSNVKLKCAMRPNNPQHDKLLRPYMEASPHQSYYDSVTDFVNEMRSLLSPGSKRVYRPGGTGNNVKVAAFIRSRLLPDVAPPHRDGSFAKVPPPHRDDPFDNDFFVGDAPF
jgi:hypothetical protein